MEIKEMRNKRHINIPDITGCRMPLVKDQNFYKNLLFVDILRNKIISHDSFEKLHKTFKDYKVNGIQDTNGGSSFEVFKDKYRPEGYRIVINDEKLFQIKVDFHGEFITNGSLVVEYELK